MYWLIHVGLLWWCVGVYILAMVDMGNGRGAGKVLEPTRGRPFPAVMLSIWAQGLVWPYTLWRVTRR